jgi:flavin reductase (DIM6/NTAB) family NADH-FMN oxidoreductase RutF
MGQIPTSVVVVAGLDEQGRPHGITIGSFVSVSLQPTLVGFLIGVSSRTWPSIAGAGRFCVNVLAEDQGDLCWRFAAEEGHDFDGVPWSVSSSGVPRIHDVAAWVDCTLESASTVGDHLFVVGGVIDLEARSPEASAMVFHRGRVSGVAARGDSD